VEVLSRVATYFGEMIAAFLPHRHWARLPASFAMKSSVVVSGALTLFAGAAVGIPGFLEHAAEMSSLGTSAVIANAEHGREVALSPGFAGLSLFTFLLLTPTGWVTLYLLISGALRMGAGWFDDDIGDPILTALDRLAWRLRMRRRAERERRMRLKLEGPEIPDRVISSATAGIGECDLVIVTSRRKQAWERGVVVFTENACYRIGEPVERTIQGRLRTLYPLTEHRDLEVVRKSVRYDLARQIDVQIP
jgi:hypothetical protein